MAGRPGNEAAAMTAATAAEIRALTHRYGEVSALDEVSLTIPAGCMAGLIGPDGAGKSTVLALIAGVRRIQAGELEVLGGDIKDAAFRRATCARIAYMPQGLGRNLYPTLSVFENVDFFGRLFGLSAAARHARIAELLAATGLAPFPDRPAGKLSGGMKQKLGLCCALIHDPDLLILDEPTTGVDPLSRRQFWELIERIRGRRPGMSVVIATGYMEEAERFDWLAAMDDGKVIASGAPAELKRRTGQASVEAAFIRLLPPEKRARHQPVVVPPRADADGAPAIEAEGLTCRFGAFTAVDHVSFRIARGEIFGFLGSNGCGKTTTMKMLTGLQPATEGTAYLFGQPLDAGDMKTRLRVGYMSQAFSLYGELTVGQNLDLHAHLFRLAPATIDARVAEMLERFELERFAESRPDSLPLGIRQRLQLAVAVIHRPEILILDEPTSGVDPVQRDEFWRYLIQLSREDGVTIFLSTHFMNEAERCDRISLMHAGRVLAVGTPGEIVNERGAASLELAFIDYLKQSIDEGAGGDAGGPETEVPAGPRTGAKALGHRYFDVRRLWAYARRETMEIIRDPVRIAFALLGPVILLITFGYGVSLDIENLTYAAFDQDQSRESRELLENLSGSRYFTEHREIRSAAELEDRLRSGELKLAIEIPAGFGRNLLKGTRTEVAAWLDGAMPFRAETTRSYLAGLVQQYAAEQLRQRFGRLAALGQVDVQTRFRYNQSFKSAFAIVPSVITLLLIVIPAMLTAVGVVREKENGSIANFRSTPVTGVEFLVGKQLPYVAIASVSFATLVILAQLLFGVGIKGSALALAVGGFAYVVAATGFGLLVSSFTRTQVAALFATIVISLIPAINFSGLFVPVSSLSGSGRLLGLNFPAAWFEQISVGTFTKALGFGELWQEYLILSGFALVFMAAAVSALRKQEA